MVQPIGIEPMTSAFAGLRSNPTELRLHVLRASWQTVEVDTLLVYHRLRNKVFLLSFEEESALVYYAKLHQRRNVFGGEFLFGKVIFVFVVTRTALKARVVASLGTFVAHVHASGTLLVFGKFTGSSLLLYNVRREAVFICHTRVREGF